MEAINDWDFEYGIVSMSDVLYFVVVVYIKLDEQSLDVEACIKCMIIWLLYTIRIYSNDSKEEINMIINTYIYVITILFNCSHHVHVIFKNPSRY